MSTRSFSTKTLLACFQPIVLTREESAEKNDLALYLTGKELWDATALMVADSVKTGLAKQLDEKIVQICSLCKSEIDRENVLLMLNMFFPGGVELSTSMDWKRSVEKKA